MMVWPKVLTQSFVKSSLKLAFFILLLDNSNGMSHNTTSVMIDTLVFPMIAGILTDFIEWAGFPSPKRYELLLSEVVIDFVSSSHRLSIYLSSHSCPHTVLVAPQSSSTESHDSATRF